MKHSKMKSSIKVTFLGKLRFFFFMVSFTQLHTTHGTKNQLSPETSELNGLRKKCMIPVLPVQVDQGVKCGTWQKCPHDWHECCDQTSQAARKISIWHLRISTANLSHFKSFNTFFGARKTQNIPQVQLKQKQFKQIPSLSSTVSFFQWLGFVPNSFETL